MSTDMLVVFGILVISVTLFASDLLRLDIVALLALLALVLSGILSPAEALAGFSDPIVLMIAGLFVVGGGLFKTGVADALGAWLGRVAGASEPRLVALVMGAAAFLSAFMSSTGAVAILLPVVVGLGWSARISPSRLLIPLAYGSVVGGLLTLIGTPPNIVVSNQLAAAGYDSFGFFSFTPVGLVAVLLSIAFMVLAGRHMLPKGDPRGGQESAGGGDLSLLDLAQAYQLPGSLFRLRVRRMSPLAGLTLAQAGLREQYGVTVVALQRANHRPAGRHVTREVTPSTLIGLQDILYVKGDAAQVNRLATEQALGIMPVEVGEGPVWPQELGMAEVLLTPRSRLVGHTLQEVRFRDRYGVNVLGVIRMGSRLEEDPATVSLRFGDTLLVQGSWKQIGLLLDERRDFVVVGQPQEMLAAGRATARAPLAILVLAGMLGVMSLNLLPHVIAVLLAAVAMVLTRCLDMEDAYRAINWQSLVLLAGMLPLATSLGKTGGVQFVAQGLTVGVGPLGPMAVMVALFLLTGLFSQFISNTATTVLIAPIALEAARALEVSPQAYLMAVAVAASSAFASPIATSSNTLVLGPGGYSFRDYVKAGLSVQGLILLATVLFLPMLFPFQSP